ncbi:hypothetical protein E2R60_16140 [Paenibacillus dendritiformis]|nr:hypothetical protein E2R60_16140 [Paenibacillus dendritiformis]
MVWTEDWNGVTEIEHDALGHMTHVTDPKQHTVSYTWTPNGQKASLHIQLPCFRARWSSLSGFSMI